jgi:hypothetical protein
MACDVEFLQAGTEEPRKQNCDVNLRRRAHQQLGGVSMGTTIEASTLRSDEALS